MAAPIMGRLSSSPLKALSSNWSLVSALGFEFLIFRTGMVHLEIVFHPKLQDNPANRAGW
jgi:hypothetical protein